MWLLSYILFLYFEKCISIGVVPSHKLNQSLQIKTSHGLIQGSERNSVNGETYFSYVGLPFARPPVNKLRFKSPKPLSKWANVLDATVKGPCCAGLNITGLIKVDFKPAGKEDCLYLNVYTPKGPNERNRKNLSAVMVYVYGGGFFAGCSNEYGADFFIEDDVVLVVPNFRISIFGYLSTEDMESPGNFALKDLIAALQWVQLNIEKFGGDPKRVTIFGQSAGAANVNALLLSQRTKGLFHGAIPMSGSSLSFWSYQTEQRRIAFDLGVSIGFETTSSKMLIDKLREVDTNVLLEGQIPPIMINFLTLMTNGLPITPCVEPIHKEAVITDYPYNILEKGEFNRVPVMIGVTTGEMALFRSAIRFAKPLLVLFNLSPGSLVRMTKDIRNRTVIANKILNYFFNTTDILKATEGDLIKFLSDEGYLRPLRKTASLLAKYTPVYFYEFSYEGQLGIELIRRVNGQPEIKTRDFKGVSHSEDIAYLFAFEEIEMEHYRKEMEFIKKLTKIYTNFAKTGNPTPVQDPFLDNVTWPRVTPGQCPYVSLGKRFTEVQDNFNENNFQFWEMLYNTYAEKPYKVY